MILRSRPTTRYVRHALFSKLGLGVAPPPSPVETDTLLKRALGVKTHESGGVGDWFGTDLPSRPSSNRACGFPAHGSPTVFT